MKTTTRGTLLGLIIIWGLCLRTSAAEMGRGNWWIAQKRLQGNALLKKGLLDVTLYDGWEGNAVDPTGARDSTKALQQAINDARDHALVVFF